MSHYTLKEMFYTLQGEGANTGRPAVFCRFAGCNLWSGREQDRQQAVCQFCDTDFVGFNGQGGGRFVQGEALANAIVECWPKDAPPSDKIKPLVVLTGGEPMLQVDMELIDAIHEKGFEVAIETNGTIEVPREIDWICVSPKAGAELQQLSGDELKLIYPQPEAPPEKFVQLAFKRFFLQPMDGDKREENTTQAVTYCMAHPQWNLSLQTHKILGID